MRRQLALILVAVLALGGCGSSASSSANPVGTELSYFPASSPLVLSIATDPNSGAIKNAEGLISRFPGAAFGEAALVGKLQQLGIDYQKDIHPLFGNPIMIGVTGPTFSSTGASSSYLAVWVTKDSGALSSLIKRLPGIHMVGSHAGANLYQSGGATTVAVDGATVVLGPSTAAVDSALDRHASGGGLSNAAYASAMSGLPSDALVQVFGNLTGVLSQASAANARRVPWVGALRGYAATVTAGASGLAINFRLDTSGGSLSPNQLPIAETSSIPGLAGNLPITVGVEDPAQIAQFIESAMQATSPASYARFLKREAVTRRKTGVDLNSFIRLLTGELIVASDMHTTMARVGVSSGATAGRTLARLMSAPHSVFSGGARGRSLGGGFYAISESGKTIDIGVLGDQLLVGRASVPELRAFATAPTTPAPGARGAVAFRITLGQLVGFAMHGAPPQIAKTLLAALGDLTGWMAASPSSLTGQATIALH